MESPSILITGCSSGIGYDAAHTLQRRGWRVFATCRQNVDAERLRQEGLESFTLDYASTASVHAGAEQVLDLTGGRLNALFNNGAFSIPGAVEDLPRDALRSIFETNLFGQFDLINRILPAMRRAGRGRIVNCSSVLGFAPLKYRGAYNATKFAMEGLTDTLRLETRSSPVQVILIEPGPIRTRIRINARAQFERWIDSDASVHRATYESSLKPRLYATDPPPDPFELAPAAVTRKLVHALESRRPAPRYFVTTPTYIAAIVRRLLTTRAYDRFADRR